MYIGVAAFPFARVCPGSEDILLGGVVVALDNELQRTGIDEGSEAIVGQAKLEGEVLAGGEVPFKGGAVQHKTVTQAGHHVFLAALVFPIGGHGARAQV